LGTWQSQEPANAAGLPSVSFSPTSRYRSAQIPKKQSTAKAPWWPATGAGHGFTEQGVTHVKSLQGFKDFIMRGNLIELAVAVVIGTAFTAVIAAVVKDLITPLIAAIGGQHDFSGLQFTLHGSTFRYGDFINALISFLIIAAVVYFLVLAPMTRVMSRFKKEAEVTTRDCPECLSTIPLAASKCMYCTSTVSPLAQ
jgi:large conductance mechanosensitive channel